MDRAGRNDPHFQAWPAPGLFDHAGGEANPHGGTADEAGGDATGGSIESEASVSRRGPLSSPKISGGKTGAGEPKAQAAVEDI